MIALRIFGWLVMVVLTALLFLVETSFAQPPPQPIALPIDFRAMLHTEDTITVRVDEGVCEYWTTISGKSACKSLRWAPRMYPMTCTKGQPCSIILNGTMLPLRINGAGQTVILQQILTPQ